MPHVLVAEDSLTQATHFRAILLDADYEVSVVHNGEEALAKIGEKTPDVVVTDLLMPKMNGLELVNAMRLQYPNIPTILMTAHGSEDLAEQDLDRALVEPPQRRSPGSRGLSPNPLGRTPRGRVPRSSAGGVESDGG